MSNVVFQNIEAAPSLDGMSFFVGTHNNGDGTYSDYLFTPAQIINYVIAQSHRTITIGTGGTTLTNAFFSNTISEITTQGQSYIVGVDFTQSGTTITGVTISFTSGQVLIAKI